MNIPNCPNCNNTMEITKLHCSECDITIEGKFTSSPLSVIDKESLGFLEEFILARGNIKELEKRLGISYPTVRAKIDSLVSIFENIQEQRANQLAEQADREKKVNELSNKY